MISSRSLFLLFGRIIFSGLLVVHLPLLLEVLGLVDSPLSGLDHALVEALVLLLDHHHAKAILLILHLLGDLVLVDDLRFAEENLKRKD
jgi:hypothetical protein